jgi:hypothetical protein
MLLDMSKRPRVAFDCDDVTKYAIGLRALRTSESVSEIITAAVRSFLPGELAEAEEYFRKGGASGQSKRGRKPRGE